MKLNKNSFIKSIVGKSHIGFPIFVVLFFISLNASAQRYEIGLGIGGMSYTGDLTRDYKITDNRLGGVAFFRQNINNALSVRYSLTVGKIQASDKNPIDVFEENRQTAFNILAVEPSAIFEYNFIDYRHKNSSVKFSPYFFAGVGVLAFFGQEASPQEYSTIQPIIPFGAGIKYDINRQWGFNFEFGARKTFFDYLDNVSIGDTSGKDYQYGNRFDNDMYYFAGISITYRFYSILCPYDFYGDF